MILDLFAGPGGWSEGLRLLGLVDVGIEWDARACATRAAAGHRTIRADVSAYPTAPFVGKVEGLIASPPCPDFSQAGRRAGLDGDSGRLMLEVPRWVEAVRPRWVACEQVPPALDHWRGFAELFRSWGYSAWCGVLNAADYGVPQTRNRAYLIASLDRAAVPPAPTHCPGGAVGLFGELAPWVSMAEALGWTAPEAALVGAGTLLKVKGTATMQPRVRAVEEPAPALAFGKNAAGWEFHPEDVPGTEAIRVTVRDALILQGFDPDYPVRGTKTSAFQQIGNAVCPPVAAAVVGALTR